MTLSDALMAMISHFLHRAQLVFCFVLFAPLLLVTLSTPAFAGLGASVTLASGQPGTIYPGQITQLQITLSNNNASAQITGASFSNSLPGTLPNGLRIAGASSYTCADGNGPVAATGSLTAAAGTQAIVLSGGTIPVRVDSTDGTCTVNIPVTSGTSTGNSATYTYTINSGAVTGNDGAAVQNVGAVSQSINISALARPSISKTFTSSTLNLGGNPTTLTITISNTNPVTIPNFSVTDVFPQLGGSGIIRVAGVPAASSTCTGGGIAPAFSPAAGATSLSATGGSVAANGSCTISVSVEAAHTNASYTTGARANTINASTQFSNDLGIPAAANASANVTVNSPLGVAKAFAHGSLSSGQSDSLTITLSNSGNSPLTVTTFDDSPIDGVAGTTYGLVASGGSTTCSGGTVSLLNGGDGIRLSGGTIPAGGSCTITVNITGTVQTAGVPISYTNTIAQGTVGTTTPGIVSQSRTASILVADDLRVTKTATPANPAPGNPVRFAVTVQNYAATAITNLEIADEFINGMTFLTGTINGNNYTPSLSGTGCAGLSVTGAVGATEPEFTIGTVPARTSINTPGSCTVTFWAMTSTSATNGSSISNTIAAGDVCYNGGATCNGGASNTTGGSVTTTILSANKSFNPAGPLSEGTVSTMTIALTNLSANPLTNVSVSDTLPTSGSGQLRIATPANAASTCGSPTITATAGSTSLSINGGTIPARAANGTGAAGTCFIRVDVVGPAGTYNNTASVAGTETYANGVTHTVGPVSANASITYNSSLSATKSFSPAAVSSGGKSTVTVRLNNAGAVALTNVAVTDPLPAGMVVANPANAYTTCAGSTSVTAVAGSSSASLNGASIAGGGNCDFLFDVIATGSANWTNNIPIGNITADGGVRNQTAVVGTLSFNSPTSLTVFKATNPSTLTFPGQVSRFTITITNGTQAVTNLRLTDYFTANGTSGAALNGMVIAASPAASTTCPGGIVSAATAGTTVGVSGVSLASSASCTVSVNVTSTAVGGITNYIPAGSILTDQGLTNSGEATTSLTTQSNLGVTKSFTPNVVKPGQRSRLRITFFNPTSIPMGNLAVTDTLSAGVTVPSGPNPATTCTGATVSSPAANQVQVAGGTIAAASGGISASCYAEIDVLVTASGDYVNTIPVGGVTATSGGSPVSNSQPASDTLRAKSPLVVHKAIASLTLDAGNPAPFTTGSATRGQGAPATMTFRLANINAVSLTGAAFTDTLPTGLVVAITPNASTTCSGGVISAPASSTSIRLSGATIPASGSCTVTVDVLSNISGVYINTIPASGVTTLDGVSNDEPTSAQLIVSTPPAVSKQFSPAVIPPNGTSTLTIYFTNDNTSSITLSPAFTDTLPTAPGAILVAATPSKSSTCGGGAGAVTAVAGAGIITFASSNTIPAGGCSISVNVTGAAAGVHTNNIPAGALQTNMGNNQQPANATLAVSTLGYISGRVFRDNNVTPNGTFESGTDTPIAGVSLELHSGATCGGALVSVVGLVNPVVTDAAGNYLFAGLPAGTYSVCEPVQPSGTTNGITTAGSITSVGGSTGTAGTASNPTATTSQIVGIVLNAAGGGQISGSPNNNFAEVVLSSISGMVFLDQNNNGTQNGSDAGIAGVTIDLLNGSGAVVATATTDASGNYIFSGLQPGTYSVREPTQPSGTANGITTPGAVPNSGTPGTATGVLVLPSRISSLVLPPNTASTGNNFAEIPNTRTLSGRVFLDYNNNGTLNGPDHGIGGQTINLTGTDINGNAVTPMTTTTADDGSYSFTGLPEGTYTVTQPNQPTGTTSGITSAGSTGGSATAPTVTPSVISSISLVGTNTVSAENNFAEIPGASPDLTVTKTNTPSSFGAGSSTGYYTITVSNHGTVDTSGTVTVVDTLPAGITAAATPTGSGWTCTVAGQTVTCTRTATVAAGAAAPPITLRAAVSGTLAGQILTNTVVVSGGGEPAAFNGDNTASDPATIAATASVAGTVWRDTDHDRVLDPDEQRLAGWQVELLLNGVQVASMLTDASGAYAFTNLSPSSGYQIRFREPANGAIYGYAVPNEQGLSFSNGVVDPTSNPAGASDTDGTLTGLTLVAGANITQQSLPVDPSGIVYDSVTRLPVSGATVTLTGPAGFNPATQLLGGAANVTQLTGADGFYQYLLLPGAPAGVYTLTVTSPPGYVPAPSGIIPPTPGAYTPGSGIIQAQPAPPTGSQPTTYYFSFNIGPASPHIVNNHIPVDPVLGGAIVVTKRSPLVNVSRGDLVPYTIEATNTLAAGFPNVDLEDLIPPGFKYRTGSATLNGVPTEPTVAGRTLRWPNLTFAPAEKKTIKLLLVVGSGVSDGNYTNQAWAMNNIVASRISNIGLATVRIIPDPTFDCSDIIGKVFDDANANGYQDEGEAGIPNVRIVTAKGWLITTDAEGRFHVACAAIPREDRGANFIMKLDERTLPSGFRVTTENPRTIRLTRGKMSKLNFGATIHRVVRVEVGDPAFVGDSADLQPEWAQRFKKLPDQLKTKPSIVRLAYRLEGGDRKRAENRLDRLADTLRHRWKEMRCCYPLAVETEIMEVSR
jgi:uncharacterized repeat protein (TIGR01451 family)